MLKAILTISLLATLALADENADRVAIARTVAAAMKSDAASVPELLAPDFDGQLITLPAARPWCELDCPRVTIGAVRFITPDVALLEGTATGDEVLSGGAFIAVLKKIGNDWRIASMRRVMPPNFPTKR
jgi:hypothetical protein